MERFEFPRIDLIAGESEEAYLEFHGIDRADTRHWKTLIRGILDQSRDQDIKGDPILELSRTEKFLLLTILSLSVDLRKRDLRTVSDPDVRREIYDDLNDLDESISILSQ